MIQAILRFFVSRHLWNFLGLSALGLVIWVAGPLLAIGQVRPLETESSRQALIAALFAVWVLRLLWSSWRRGRLNAQLLGHLRRIESVPKAQAHVTASPEVREMEVRFDEAVNLLRKARQEDGNSRGVLSRFSREYLYHLPWYVFVGAPGAGKTTALANSGLNFPLADHYGRSGVRGVGGTRNCDWWFTDDAILLDTAGRYTTHESDPVGDEGEWKGFMGLLSRFRGRQPINGAILTISLADLLSASDGERVQHAAALRRRLQELREELGIQFPIYVVVTKMDLLAGFEPYFCGFGREDLQQVWGFTLPYAASQEKTFDLFGAFNSEFEHLARRLNDGLPEVMVGHQEDRERALAYLFPQQFASLQGKLAQFLSDVFSVTRFETRLVPRGVYFTSGTQGTGEGFDQITGKLRRYLGLNNNLESGRTGDVEGRSYFVKDLLQEVIFKESGLAGRNLRWERGYRRAQWAGYILMGAVLLALFTGWAVSYSRNVDYLADVSKRVPAVEDLGKRLTINEAGNVVGLMPFMDALWRLPQGERFDAHSPPFGYGFGLYQGKKILEGQQSVYRSTLDQVLLPEVARRVESALRAAPPDDLEYGYEVLRAYLMLYEPDHYDADFMLAWLLADMRRTLPDGYTKHQYDMMSLHLKNLVQGRMLLSPFPKDEELVAQVRARLSRYSLAQRSYSRLRRILTRGMQLPPTTIVSLAGPQASAVFYKRTGEPLTSGISALYSYEGYWNVFNPRVEQVAERLRDDDAWVLGTTQTASQVSIDHEALVREVRRLYLNDYVAKWNGLLGDLRLAPHTSLLQSIQTARTLSEVDSPLVQLVRSVARETTLLRDSNASAGSFVDEARTRVSSTREALEEMFGPSGPGSTQRADTTRDRLEAIVDQHFEAFRRLVTPESNGTAAVFKLSELINELYSYLVASDAALRSANPTPRSDIVTKLRAEAGRMPEPIRGILGDLSTRSSGEITGGAQEQFGSEVAATIGVFCRQSIAGRYPFSSSSKLDVAPNDLARLFAPGSGMMDEYFQRRLAGQIDVSGRRWRFKPDIEGHPGKASAMLDAFQRATVIRDVYFSQGAAAPQYRVSIRPVEMDSTISQFLMDIDGQVVRYAHGPQISTQVTWPGPRGGNQVRIELQPPGGAGLVANGPWALNRILQKATLSKGTAPESIRAVFDVQGRKITLEITANSVRSPFDLPEMRGFVCPGRY